MSGALFVALRNGFFPVLDGRGYYLFIATLAIGGALPFAVDRVLAPRLAGIPRSGGNR
jgi:apolipoprotein N-acyltransferase